MIELKKLGLTETDLKKPFGDYKDFQDCIDKNQEKHDPEAYCATIQRQVEGKTKQKPEPSTRDLLKLLEPQLEPKPASVDDIKAILRRTFPE